MPSPAPLPHGGFIRARDAGRDVLAFLRAHARAAIGISVALALVLAVLLAHPDRRVARLHPRQCVGTAADAHRAAGVPENAPGDHAGMHAATSAILHEPGHELHCLAFSGDIPEGTYPTRIRVIPHWRFVRGGASPVEGLISVAYAQETDGGSSDGGGSGDAGAGSGGSDEDASPESNPDTVAGDEEIVHVHHGSDGESWNHLGAVTSTEADDEDGATFEIPLDESPSWEDAQGTHVRLTLPPGGEDAHDVYVDGLTMEVEYEDIGDMPPAASSTVATSAAAAAIDPASLRFSRVAFDGIAGAATTRDDADGTQWLVLSGLPAANLRAFSEEDPAFSFATGIGTEPLELPAYFFPPGSYTGIVTRDPASCVASDIDPCESALGALGSLAFAVAVAAPVPEPEATTTASTSASAAISSTTGGIATSTERTVPPPDDSPAGGSTPDDPSAPAAPPDDGNPAPPDEPPSSDQ